MEKKTVLIVDDSPMSLKHAQSILRDCFSTACTKSGRRAMEYLAEHRPDMILLDLKMPEMGGDELQKLIRANEKLADIPVVFLTGDEDGNADCLGAEGVLQKPAEPQLLMALAKKLTGTD